MATVSTSTYLDSLTRTAGEAMTIDSGAVLTVRTDYRVSSGAPASNLGSLASITCTEGEFKWDSSAVRQVDFNTGSGNVPAIGTTITQGAVSGYLLGVWAGYNTAQTAVGDAMPTSGFIKFREVTGGTFAAGVLTGIGATATAADRQSWISLPHDAGANFTVPRLGKHTARGGRFFLADTTGVRGQTFQIPSDGSAAVLAPGLMIETGVGTDQYEFWPALNTTAGWTYVHVGNATGTTDVRQKFLKATAGGLMIMGETWSVSATYASIAAQAGTYAQVSHTCTYTWVNDVVEVYYASGHQLETGQQTGLDFTSGGATAYDGIYTVTVLDAYRFTVPLSGSGAGGAVTSRPGVTVTFTAHGQNIGESVYCDFTSGTGVDGTYEIYIVGSNAYTVKYPSATVITSGNVSCLHTLQITYTAHGLAVGQTIYCDFTSGAATNDGVYPVKAVAANTININYPHSAAITTSNVTISRDIGYVCEAGRKTWIPSNILHEVATGARATNTIPNATIATRPEWTTTSAGALDLEYVYGTTGYLNSAQAYSMRLRNCVLPDSASITEVATALDIDGLYFGMLGGLDVITLTLGNNYAGGTVANVKAHRGNTPGTSDHATSINYCYGTTFNNFEAGIVQYARSSGLPMSVTYLQDVTFNNPRVLNGNLVITASQRININDIDYCERFNGHGLAALTAVSVGAGSANITIDGETFGYGGIVPNQEPYSFAYAIGAVNVKLRNVGSLASPIPLKTWAPNLSQTVYVFQSGGSNANVKIQKVFIVGVRTAPFASVNSDKNMLYETCQFGNYVWSVKALLGIAYADLNGTIKNCYAPNSTTGQASVYGTHFADHFLGSGYGRFWLNCNEPTSDTNTQFSNVVGTALFNSSGGVIVRTINNQCYFTDNVFRKGHTGFNKTEVIMSGGTLTNYNLHYQIDLGAAFSDWKNLYYQRAGGSGTSGQFTFTVTDATGVAVGDYCFGTGLSTVGLGCKDAAIPKVTQVNGNTITVDVANTGTVSGIIRFTQLPSETVDPAVGFKLKWRITTVATATAAITHIRVETLSSDVAKDNYYPLDVVDIEVTALDISGNPVEDVQVLLIANSGGNLPYRESVTISNSSTTATVTHTSHGLSTNDKILIKGASHYQNNGVFQIVVTDVNTYTYTMLSAPGSSPSGTITATFVFISSDTDAQGKVRSSMYVASDQPVTGTARKSNASPYYKTSTILDTVSSASGASINTFMLLDE